MHEPSQPDASDIVPKVVMATVESWEAKSRWFFDVNRDQFEVTPAIQAKVDEILEDAGVAKGTDEEKAEALVHWVAQNIRYSGQTMGEGEGFTLHPADMIFEQRSGVCKDIAGMLITMMRAAGLDSYAAMTMAGSRIEEVPADQFNHCVTALRLADGSWQMYDPTWVPYNNDIWSKLETEQHYLIGSPEGEGLSRIAYSPPEESPLKVRHTATLSEDGTLTGTLRLDGGGASDSRLRRIVNGSRKQELAGAIAHVLAVVSPRVEGVKVTHRATDDFSGDMWITVEYRIPRFVTGIAGAWTSPAPCCTMRQQQRQPVRAPAAAPGPTNARPTCCCGTPSCWTPRRPSPCPRAGRLQDEPKLEPVDETYASFAGTAAQDGRKLTVSGRAEVKRRQIPPDGYPGFKAALDAAKAWTAQEFRFTKEGK